MEFRESSNEQRAKAREQATASTTATLESEATPEPKPKTTSTKAKAKTSPKPKAQATAQTRTVAARHKTSGSARLGTTIYYLTGLVEVFLILRLVSAIFDTTATTNNQSGVSLFIFNVANPLTHPFYGLFNAASGSEPTARILVMAIIVYGLIGWGVGRLVKGSRA